MKRPASLRQCLIAAAICAVLSACGGQPIDVNAGAPRIDDQSMGAAPGAHTDTATGPETKTVVSPTVSAPQQAAIDPASLVGMTGARISSLFGTPVFVRRDPPGEFWRYRGKTCVLELFFYLRGGTQTVDHIETRASGGAKLDQADCVAILRKAPARS